MDASIHGVVGAEVKTGGSARWLCIRDADGAGQVLVFERRRGELRRIADAIYRAEGLPIPEPAPAPDPAQTALPIALPQADGDPAYPREEAA